MAEYRATVFYMAKKFVGLPKHSDFELKEEILPPLKDGDVLLEAEWLSLDPFQRVYMQPHPPGKKMIGSQIARIVESRNPNYAVGDHLIAYAGWASHSVANPDAFKHVTDEMERYERVYFPEMPLSYSLGVLGMPGVAAYFGLLEVCKPKTGDVVVVSAAAGAVGSIVGQIAKIKGCTVIGFTGTDEKVDWLKRACKLDFAFNYKKVDVAKVLKESAPTGVDCYFDNVGGTLSSSVLVHMKRRGRVAISGAISLYNHDMLNPPLAPAVQGLQIWKEVSMEAFIVDRWMDRYGEARRELYKWFTEGKIITSEKVYEGFENMPTAFIGLLTGENTGKTLVRAKKP